MKLYELSQNYKNLQELLDNEDIPQELITNALNEVEGQIEEKAEEIAKVIRNMESDIETLKSEEQRLSAKRKAIENRVSGIKGYLDTHLKATGVKKIKGKIFTLSIQKNAPSVLIVREEAIPDTFYKIKKELSKSDILKALKEGQEVPGATIQHTESLRIK